MGAEASGRLAIDEAWQLFAQGDHQGAVAKILQVDHDGPESQQAIAAHGFFLMETGQLEDAAALLLPACARGTRHAPLHWYAGHVQQRLGNIEAAALAFAHALALDPSLDDAAYALAWVLHDLGRTKEALLWAKHALEKVRLPQRLHQCAWLEQVQGNHAAAAQLWQEAIYAFPSTAAIQTELNQRFIQCLVALDKTAIALKWTQDRLRDFPESGTSWYLMGLVQQEMGDLHAAEFSFALAHERDASLSDALLRLAGIQRQWKQFSAARNAIGLVLKQTPGHPTAQVMFAQVLLDLNEVWAARRFLVPILRGRRDRCELLRLWAATQSRQGRHRRAMHTLQRALRIEPCNVEALRSLGWEAHECGECTEAVAAVQRLLEMQPDDASAQAQAAFVFAQAGAIDDAQCWAERAAAGFPGLHESWRALSAVRMRQARHEEVIAAAQQALELSPANADCLRQLGLAYLGDSQLGASKKALGEAFATRPEDFSLGLELAQAQCLAGSFQEALLTIKSLRTRRPHWLPAWVALARIEAEAGMEGAVASCDQLLRIGSHAPGAVQVAWRLIGLGIVGAPQLLDRVPTSRLLDAFYCALQTAIYSHSQRYLENLTQFAVHSFGDDTWVSTAALYALSTSPISRGSSLALQTQSWFRAASKGCGPGAFKTASRPASNDRRPRIAYIASQQHQSLLGGVLAAHSAERAHVWVYTNQPLHGLPSHVKREPLLPDSLAESFAARAIDVVIDTGGLQPLAGQFEVLHALAQRLAPVQIGWLGYWGSAGGLFDALLADEVSVPPAHEPNYEEKILRLNGGQWCWTPPSDAPEVSELPMLESGSVTWGVTSRSLKLSPDCLDTFAQIVASTPRSIIRFKGEIAVDWPLRRSVLACMAEHGVDADRVFFDPFEQPARYMAWLRGIDLVLDSFPSNGGLCLLEPLWMGVPVVTLAGDWAGARQGAALLQALGLGQWIANTAQGYCAIAKALAIDVARLAQHRRTLRARFSDSPLTDGRRVASQIETICRDLLDQLPEIRNGDP